MRGMGCFWVTWNGCFEGVVVGEKWVESVKVYRFVACMT